MVLRIQLGPAVRQKLNDRIGALPPRRTVQRCVAGAVDLYAGWEQRIDAGQFTRDTTRWMQAGVRMTVPAP